MLTIREFSARRDKEGEGDEEKEEKEDVASILGFWLGCRGGYKSTRLGLARELLL